MPSTKEACTLSEEDMERIQAWRRYNAELPTARGVNRICLLTALTDIKFYLQRRGLLDKL
jgi:hypothetical protein